MDGKGLRALIWVLVVACSITSVPASTAAVADTSAHRMALQADNGGNESMTLEDADKIHIDVFIAENGSAQLSVDYQFHLDRGNNSTSQWDRLRTDIETNTSAYVADERSKWIKTLAAGENATDRDMNISNVSITTEENTAPRTIGHVTVSFQWSKFAFVELNRIEAGAALSGLTLDDGTTLQFHWPESYAIYQHEGEPQVDPAPSETPDGSVTWNGKGTSFTDGQPRIILVENTGATTEPANPDQGPPMPWTIVALALALLATVGAVGWLLGRRRRHNTVPTDASTETVRRTDGSSDDDSTVDEPPPELLSNEERVLRLLENRGGRIKQQEVVSELDWTEAKTSQVVGDLREDDKIDVFRIGRENVLTLPDEE
ncbi:helix-turn-helix transcriptional regulator [Natrinema sp. 74]|uniref:helix-turn-helix transcriptional regulator n=1 Tax=Natrinema sp. 74 TaxID=3384159 RepID=UPI0038D4FF26